MEEFETPLQRYALRLSGDEEQAKDLVQETFIKMMSNLHKLKVLNQYQRKAWMYRVLKNHYIDQVRAQNREQALLQRLSDITQEHSDPVISISLNTAFDRIPEQYRDVLNKRYVMGMNSEEIGKELGIPSATVRSRILQATKWLRTHQSWIN
jgi:RNA polymerase sigma-70 factor (ECF subfamily)